MVMFPVVALVLSTLFEELIVDGTIVVGTLFVLAGNLFVLYTCAHSALDLQQREILDIGRRV